MSTMELPLAERKLKWPNTPEWSAWMRANRDRNLRRSLHNHNENWMADILAPLGLTWKRQAMWGCRIFDFWCAEKGIVIEVDGPEHEKQKAWDSHRDGQNFKVSGILVLRVRNQNADDAAEAVREIEASSTWNIRRMSMGLISAGSSHPDHFVFEGPSLPPPPRPPRVRSPKVPKVRPPKAPPPPRPTQARCSTCGQRIRKRRPDGRIRCRCKSPV